MQMIDFEALGDTSHKSISGGIATHSFDKIDSFKASDFSEVLNEIKKRYGCTPYLFDDRLEYQVNDSETLSFYLDEIKKVNEQDLKTHFPELESY